MKVIAIQSSPNRDGLTVACASAALRGAQKAGAETDLITLTDLVIHTCLMCDRNKSLCHEKGRCEQKDDFNMLRETVNAADAVVFATPVYFGDPSEVAKCFLDRWRRCEVIERDKSVLRGKRIIGIAAAGGSGMGAITTLGSLERYFQWLQFTIWELAPVTQINRRWALKAIEEAGRTMVTEPLPV